MVLRALTGMNGLRFTHWPPELVGGHVPLRDRPSLRVLENQSFKPRGLSTSPRCQLVTPGHLGWPRALPPVMTTLTFYRTLDCHVRSQGCFHDASNHDGEMAVLWSGDVSFNR